MALRTLTFVLGSAAVSAAVSDPETADAVAELFRPLRRDGEDGGRGVPDVVIDGRAPSWHLRATGPDAEARRFRSRPDLLSDVELILTRRLLERLPELVQLHAAGALVEGRAVVAMGESGAGKSSLALAWSVAGLPLLGDDTLLVDEGGCLLGVQRLVKAHRDVLRLHGVRPRDTVAPQRGSAELWWDPRRGGGWAAEPTRPVLVARVHYVEGAALELKPLPAGEGLRALLDHATRSAAAGEPLDRLIAMVEAAELVDVRFGSSVQAAAELAARAAARGRG